MDKNNLKNDFKKLINDISSDVMNNSVFKLLEKLKDEITVLTSSLTQQIKSFSKVSNDIPARIDQKIGQFDKLQKDTSASIEKNSERLKNEVDRMVDNNSKLESNFNNNFYQLQESNEQLHKKVLDLVKLVNVLIIIVAFSAIGIVVSMVQNQKIISRKNDVPVEKIMEEPQEEVSEADDFLPEDILEEIVEEVSINEEDKTRISKNAKEINKLWNSFSKLDNRVKSINSTNELENSFEPRFTSLENKINTTDKKVANMEDAVNEKLDNIWKFLADKGTSKMKKAIDG